MTRASHRRRIERSHVAGALLVVVCPAGCGTRGPALVPVSGSVTFDGTPVETGEILFRATDVTASGPNRFDFELTGAASRR